jgi:signal transduction histidine kinase
VNISREKCALHVHVSDNGKGFAQDDSKGLGLEGILARIHQLGGQVELKNSDSGGAIMEAIIPIGEPQ